MQSRRLGQSAIHVSDICMGTMTFGSQTDEAMAFRVLDRCFDAGINFYDTAEGYPVPPDAKWVGRTEEIVGRWMKTKPRDAIILATKVSGPRDGKSVVQGKSVSVRVDLGGRFFIKKKKK